MAETVKADWRRWTPLAAWRERRAYWRTVPMRELRYLMLAVFILFGTGGFLADVTAKGQLPIAAVALWIVVSGGFAILYVLGFARRPAVIPGVVALQFTVVYFAVRVTNAIIQSHRFPVPSMEWGLSLSVNGIWVTIVGSYLFFVAFTQTSARRAMIAQRELELAQGIQATLVPRISYRDERFEVCALTLPSDKVGGDVVDLVVHDGVLFCYVADVSGHGLQAGILMGMVKTAGRTLLLGGCGLVEMQTKMNQVLPAVKEQHMYMTFAGLRFDASDEVEYASAGHPPMLHWRAATKDFATLGVEQLPIGMFDGVEYVTDRVRYDRGDMFAITTDGVLEVENAAGGEFSMMRLAEIMRQNEGRRPEQTVEAMVNAVRSFGRQMDDQTLLVLRVL
ncbi:MAG: SpoIIE family protein phosphatase [Edaphobacter sp.]